MTNFTKKTVLGAVLAATALSAAAPAQARDRYYHQDRGDNTGAAIAGGIVGLALGALIGSAVSDNDDDRYRRDARRYRSDDRYAYRYDYRDGRYYDRRGNRYDNRDWGREGYYRGY